MIKIYIYFYDFRFFEVCNLEVLCVSLSSAITGPYFLIYRSALWAVYSGAGGIYVYLNYFLNN